jgi:esterase
MRSELATGTVKLHVDISGEGDKPVVLLHGLFGSGSNLMALARSLAPFYKVYRMDLRNHGKSAHSDFMDIAVMANDVAAAMAELGIERADLFGHSLGGKVAMELAARFPHLVHHLVVADIAPVSYGRGHDEIIAGLLGLDLRALESRQQADEQLHSAVPETAIRQFLLKNLVRQGEAWEWRMNLPVIAECYDALRMAPDPGEFTGPTLFVRGGASPYIRDENRVPIQRQFPNVAIRTIADAGHWLHAEKPQIFNEIVLSFLAAD